jgi:thymidylate synthase (FAD)
MKILQPNFEIWAQPDGLDAVYRQIERAGRVCYKSEQNTTETSARPFVERMIASEHYAMLEHGTVYLHSTDEAFIDRYERNRFSHVNRKGNEAFITTNMRVLAENKWLDDIEFISPYTHDFERRITVHFTTQVGVTREYNRHRANSMAEQSTRYCNYSKDKFGGEISINMPTWIAAEEDVNKVEDASRNTLITLCQQIISNTDKDWTAIDNWLFANLAAEAAYMNMIAMGHKPQEARVVLPLDINTELVHTGFVSDWKHFFDLRAIGTTGAPHPDAKVLALPLMEEFKKLGYIAQ